MAWTQFDVEKLSIKILAKGIEGNVHGKWQQYRGYLPWSKSKANF